MKKVYQRRWEILHNFESRQKKEFLAGLTTQASLDILGNLYRLVQSKSGKTGYRKLALRKVETLSKARSLFTKASR